MADVGDPKYFTVAIIHENGAASVWAVDGGKYPIKPKALKPGGHGWITNFVPGQILLNNGNSFVTTSVQKLLIGNQNWSLVSATDKAATVMTYKPSSVFDTAPVYYLDHDGVAQLLSPGKALRQLPDGNFGVIHENGSLTVYSKSLLPGTAKKAAPLGQHGWLLPGSFIDGEKVTINGNTHMQEAVNKAIGELGWQMSPDGTMKKPAFPKPLLQQNSSSQTFNDEIVAKKSAYFKLKKGSTVKFLDDPEPTKESSLLTAIYQNISLNVEAQSFMVKNPVSGVHSMPLPVPGKGVKFKFHGNNPSQFGLMSPDGTLRIKWWTTGKTVDTIYLWNQSLDKYQMYLPESTTVFISPGKKKSYPHPTFKDFKPGKAVMVGKNEPSHKDASHNDAMVMANAGGVVSHNFKWDSSIFDSWNKSLDKAGHSLKKVVIAFDKMTFAKYSPLGPTAPFRWRLNKSIDKAGSKDGFDISMSVKEALSDPTKANLMCSDITESGQWHMPVLDIDWPVKYIPSTTQGHGHLMIGRPLKKDAYFKLLDALVEAGIVEKGFAESSKKRGYTSVRPPWVKKPKEQVVAAQEAELDKKKLIEFITNQDPVTTNHIVAELEDKVLNPPKIIDAGGGTPELADWETELLDKLAPPKPKSTITVNGGTYSVSIDGSFIDKGGLKWEVDTKLMPSPPVQVMVKHPSNQTKAVWLKHSGDFNVYVGQTNYSWILVVDIGSALGYFYSWMTGEVTGSSAVKVGTPTYETWTNPSNVYKLTYKDSKLVDSTAGVKKNLGFTYDSMYTGATYTGNSWIGPIATSQVK